jgi:uncharacterized CHY-type Zn-finger protein
MKKLSHLLLFSLCAIFGSMCTSKQKPVVTEATTDTIPHDRLIYGVLVKGQVIDNQTRCSHWHSNLDIIALKFKCCDTYYPCYSCHEEKAGHKATTWEVGERDEKAVLCGGCGRELTIREYLASNNICPSCQASFNPNCKKHYHLYFKSDSSAVMP